MNAILTSYIKHIVYYERFENKSNSEFKD